MNRFSIQYQNQESFEVVKTVMQNSSDSPPFTANESQTESSALAAHFPLQPRHHHHRCSAPKKLIFTTSKRKTEETTGNENQFY